MSDSKNLLTNLPPPVELPSFVMQGSSNEAKKALEVSETSTKESETAENQKVDSPDSLAKTPPEATAESDLPSMQDISAALSPITDGVKNSVFYGWMKDTVKSVSKVGVEKAKASIDKVVTTLDPQMSALIYSGGNTEVVVASISDDDDEVMAIREAFQKIYGRATVYGHNTIVSNVAVQPVGFENAELFAKERINLLRSNEDFAEKVLVSVCNFMAEIYPQQWFDCYLLMLTDSVRNISLKTFTQMTPLPLDVVKKMESDTPKDYEKRSSGFPARLGNYMGEKMDTLHYEWQKKYTSIDQYDLIYNAARVLASTYRFEVEAKLKKDEHSQ